MDFQLNKKSDTLYSVTTTFDDTKEVYTVAEFILCSGGWHLRASSMWKFDLKDLVELTSHLMTLNGPELSQLSLNRR